MTTRYLHPPNGVNQTVEALTKAGTALENLRLAWLNVETGLWLMLRFVMMGIRMITEDV